MSRLSTLKPAAATGITAELFAALKDAAGMIPNCYKTIATHSPTGLKALLEMDGVIRESTLTEREIECIRLAVSIHAECDYCTAAHSYLAHFTGLSSPMIEHIRQGHDTQDARLDPLLDFVRNILSSRGTVPASAVEVLLNAGYTEQHIVETLLVIASTTFVNLVNRVNDTTIDFPQATAENVCS